MLGKHRANDESDGFAGRAGGQVLAFEPNPDVSCRLTRNVEAWRRQGALRLADISVVQAAVSRSSGSARLNYSIDYLNNHGVATLEQRALGQWVGHAEVQCTTVDELVGGRAIDLMKVDVEGHELSVFEGARESLRRKQISHIIYEDFAQQPSKCRSALERAGYEVLSLGTRLSGPTILREGEEKGEGTWVATLELSKVVDAMSGQGRKGWKALRMGRGTI